MLCAYFLIRHYLYTFVQLLTEYKSNTFRHYIMLEYVESISLYLIIILWKNINLKPQGKHVPNVTF